MTRTRVRPTAPRPLQLPTLLEEPSEHERESLGNRSMLEGARLEEYDLQHRDLVGSTWEQVVARDVTVANSDLAGSFLTDVRFDACDLANVGARGASLQRVEFLGGRALGFGCNEGVLQDVSFVDCQLDFSAIRFAKLQRVVFRRCRMHEFDLTSSQLQSVLFEDCDMSGADFTRISFERCEMRSCTLDNVRGVQDLQGIAMSMVDVVELAPLFASACGVTILAPDAADDD